jgi:hypothetical protein
MLTFLPSMAVSENGVQLAALQCALALVAIKRVRGGHAPSSAFLGLTLASSVLSAGLALSALSDNLRARKAFIQAFHMVNIQTSALTSSPSGSFPLAVSFPFAPFYCCVVPAALRRAASVFACLPMLSTGVKVKRGVCYNRTAKTALKLDVFWSATNDQSVRRPCFMYIHGGGWVAGHRQIASLPLLYDVRWLEFRELVVPSQTVGTRTAGPSRICGVYHRLQVRLPSVSLLVLTVCGW